MKSSTVLDAFTRAPLQAALLVTTSAVCGAFILVGAATGALFFAIACSAVFIVGFGVAEPLAILLLAILVSCTVGALGAVGFVELGPVKMTLSGLMTVAILTGTLISLLCHMRSLKSSSFACFSPFWIFSAWAMIRSFDAPSAVEGLRDATLFLVPPLAGVLTSVILERRCKDGDRLTSVIMYSCAIPLIVLIGSLLSGHLEFEALGFTGPIGKRPLALFLLIVLSVALARWRHADSRFGKLRGMLISCVALLIVLGSLSRMAIAVAVGLLLPLRFIGTTKGMLPRILLSGLLGLTLLGLIIEIPAVRNRFLGDSRLSLIEWRDSGFAVNTYGRDVAWSITWSDALLHPLVGSGTGSSRVLMNQWVSGLEHPHNDYLRVFHDEGLVGLLIMLWAWVGRVLRHMREWGAHRERSEQRRAERHMAATLGSISVMAAFVTDNPLVYVFVLIPVFILFSIADQGSAMCNAIDKHSVGVGWGGFRVEA